MVDLATPNNPQAQAVSEIIQRVRPDILLLNEFDYDGDGSKPYASQATELFQKNYLFVSQSGAAPIEYQHVFVAPSNTGIPSGRDLDKDGIIGGADDNLGFGAFPGQFAMAVFSKHPIDYAQIRTFQFFLWKDMPGAMLPKSEDGSDYYDERDLELFRLSSKNHWDLPINIDDQTLHLLASHPTPPIFDGPEKRNALRNHDEIRFWADYITPSRSHYIYDDQGNYGGLTTGEPFVIAGDQNADPFDGESLTGAAQQLLEHPLVNSAVTPRSEGGPEQATLLAATIRSHKGDPAVATAFFLDQLSNNVGGATGNLRADYVLPSKQLKIAGAGVFWPTTDDPLYKLIGNYPFLSSDHRLVWIDVAVPVR